MKNFKNAGEIFSPHFNNLSNFNVNQIILILVEILGEAKIKISKMK